MSSPVTPSKPLDANPPIVAESSSFTRWLLFAVGLMGLAVGLTFVVRSLSVDRPGLPFPVPTVPTGPPGKALISENLTYNFGAMAQKFKGSHNWVLKNEGPGDLLLKKGPSTCSCTIASFKEGQETMLLAAGKSTDITLTWETREFDGPYKKSATVYILNDPMRQEAEFVVEGNVRPAITIEPENRVLDFGSVPSDQTLTGKFALASADHPGLKILSLTSTRPEEIQLTSVPLTEDERRQLEWTGMKGGYRVMVELKPSRNLGVFNEEITVITDHPLLNEVKVVVGGKRSGPFTLTPDAVRVHDVDGEKGMTATIMILVRNAPDTKFEVADAPDNLKVEVIPSDVKAGTAAKIRQYRLTATVPPDTPAGVITGMITLKSDHPQAAQVKIPVEISIPYRD